MSSSERNELSNDIRDAIDEAFLFANYDETLSTLTPLELVALDRHPLYSALTNYAHYNQTFVEATFDHDSGEKLFTNARIQLRNTWIHSLRVELVINASDDDIEEDEEELIDLEVPHFYVDAPTEATSTKRERIPLNYTVCRDLLNHIVSMANPIAAITKSDRTISESIEALLAVSESTALNRSTKYSFYASEDEQVVVDIHDRSLLKPQIQPEHTYHKASVQTLRSFGKAGVLATHINMTANQQSVQTTIGKDFRYEDGVAEEIEKIIDEMTTTHQSLTEDTPAAIRRQLLDGIHQFASMAYSPTEADRL